MSKYAVDSIDELKEQFRAQSKISNGIKVLDAERRGIDERPINEITPKLIQAGKQHEASYKSKCTP